MSHIRETRHRIADGSAFSKRLAKQYHIHRAPTAQQRATADRMHLISKSPLSGPPMTDSSHNIMSHSRWLVWLIALVFLFCSPVRAADCTLFNGDEPACRAAISDNNSLFCNYVSGFCVPQIGGCEPCYSPVAGVCAPDCPAGGGACPSGDGECVPAGCENFAAG